MKKQLKHRREFVDIINELNYKKGAEIGVRDGYFSRFILKYTTIEKWYAVDPWEYNPELPNPVQSYALAKMLLEPFGDRIEMVKAFSPAAADIFEDNSLDFIYIDGMHTYNEVKADLNAWWPKLKSGGIFAGHDYHLNDWPGVYNSVNEFVKEIGYEEQFNVTKEELYVPMNQIIPEDPDQGWKGSWWFFKK